MKKHKIGEIKPDISKAKALQLHNISCSCSEPYLIKKHIKRIEHQRIFGIRYYNEYCWQCLKCKWESERMRKRNSQ